MQTRQEPMKEKRNKKPRVKLKRCRAGHTSKRKLQRRAAAYFRTLPVAKLEQGEW